MADILLVRHGQASFGAEDYDRLSAIGEEQSRLLGRWLRRARAMPDLIVTGTMRRHARTAELCALAAGTQAPVHVLAGLDEMDHEQILARHRPDLAAPGALVAELARAKDPHRAFQSLYADAMARWIGGAWDGDYSCTWMRFRENVLGALATLAGRDEPRIWAFTSGGPIAVIVNAIVGAPAERAFELAWPLVNTSQTQLSTGARRRQLVGYNAWPHLHGRGKRRFVTHR